VLVGATCQCHGDSARIELRLHGALSMHLPVNGGRGECGVTTHEHTKTAYG
jgi:hypothetical protein